jgi:hypothetical protein
MRRRKTFEHEPHGRYGVGEGSDLYHRLNT